MVCDEGPGDDSGTTCPIGKRILVTHSKVRDVFRKILFSFAYNGRVDPNAISFRGSHPRGAMLLSIEDRPRASTMERDYGDLSGILGQITCA